MKIKPKCVYGGQEDAFYNTGHIMPCCMLDGIKRLENHWLESLTQDHLKVSNVDSIKEIHDSKEWKDFYYMIFNNPEDAPEVCRTYCEWNEKVDEIPLNMDNIIVTDRNRSTSGEKIIITTKNNK